MVVPGQPIPDSWWMQTHTEQADGETKHHADRQGERQQSSASDCGAPQDQKEVLFVDGNLTKIALQHALDVM